MTVSVRPLSAHSSPLPWDVRQPTTLAADKRLLKFITYSELDLALVPLEQGDLDDSIKARMFERLRRAVVDLVRLGNQYPEISSPATALNNITARPFEEADLLDIHIEVATLTDLVAGSMDRRAAEQLDAECPGILRNVTQLGPPLTPRNADVDLFEKRNLHSANIRRDKAVAKSERAVACAFFDSRLLTERAAHFTALVAAAPDEGRITGYRVAFARNLIL